MDGFIRLFFSAVSRGSEGKTNRGLLLLILVIYLLILSGYLLWPFNFIFTPLKNCARWIEKGNGIEFPKSGLLINKETTVDLFDKMIKGSGLTIEVWIESNSIYQHGPARIISYSINHKSRNFTLGQSEDDLILRLRTSASDLNGADQQLKIEDVFTRKKIHHIAATYNFKKRCVYINGNIAIKNDQQKGDFSNWDSSHNLIIGNEASGNRAWLGKIFYAALYRRALSEQEILQNFKSGYEKMSTSTKLPANLNSGPIVSYRFDENAGNIIHHEDGNSAHINLYMPEEIPGDKVMFSSRKDNLYDFLSIKNILTNILVFFPLGFFFVANLKQYSTTKIRLTLSILIFSLTASFGFEILHHFLPDRHSSLTEVLLKMIGIYLGALTYLYLGKSKKV